MTWYEWGLCVDRINRKNNEIELQVNLNRHLMSLIANVNGNKTKPSDFLQPEEEKPKQEQISPEELDRKSKEIAKKRKRNG